MTQESLFSTPALRSTVTTERDRVLDQMAKKAGARFREDAAACILAELLVWPDGRSGEQLTAACRACGFAPPNGMDDRAFGPVLMKLAREGRIHKVGTVARAKGHGTSGGNLWALTR